MPPDAGERCTPTDCVLGSWASDGNDFRLLNDGYCASATKTSAERSLMTAPNSYTAPKFNGPNFHCPHCQVFAEQGWGIPNRVVSYGAIQRNDGQDNNFKISRCSSCGLFAIWVDGRMVYPLASTAPHANTDLPDDIKADFDEARNIVSLSPRGAAALLRLCIQKICKHLGAKGRDINDDIGTLVGKGLNPQIQQALDIVRVVGNECVHPGLMDLKDDVETANHLFGLVNLIVEDLISRPKHVSEMFDALPEKKKKAIEERDAT